MNEYQGINSNFYVSVIYFIMGIIYLLYTGIDIPGYIDNFFNKNHHLMIFLVACGYFLLSILYMYKQNVEENEQTKRRKIYVVIFISIILIYYIVRIVKTIKI